MIAKVMSGISIGAEALTRAARLIICTVVQPITRCANATAVGQAMTAARLARPGNAASHTPSSPGSWIPVQARGQVNAAARKASAAAAAAERIAAVLRWKESRPGSMPDPNTTTTARGVHHRCMCGVVVVIEGYSSAR